ncbi:uncharacterized protein NDAI_0B00110 [Naumovozyma dairenensis CBS 421]|uniref:Uncharacterized protein n=1 Tax=Naumovozyma dairenensis (strain ATCC 10597 / BCRC 20456 / CBS 421 / NBRC 0211 / NRRL Y-12639) TaxID=1071378 RepID=G0W5I4_NAUDC|nr:hypothetical protein NDAI_0B00110 [Naumovozyma dairenensis CBS 421]CCD23045.1 hypothetical protein NDAI_0B00110 [Naumovozyma dairenensis CBS 421]
MQLLMLYILTLVNIFQIGTANVLPSLDSLSTNKTFQKEYSFQSIERLSNRLEISKGITPKTAFIFQLTTIIFHSNHSLSNKKTVPIVNLIKEKFEELLVLESLHGISGEIPLKKDMISITDDITKLASQYEQLVRNKISWKERILINKGFKVAIAKYLNHNLKKLINLKCQTILLYGKEGPHNNNSNHDLIDSGYRILRHSSFALKAAINTIELIQKNSSSAELTKLIHDHFNYLPAIEDKMVLIDGIVDKLRNDKFKIMVDPPELKFLIKGLKTLAEGMVFLALCVVLSNVFCSVVFILTISVAVVIWMIIFWRMLNT